MKHFHCEDDLDAHSEKAKFKHIREALVECFNDITEGVSEEKEELKENEERSEHSVVENILIYYKL